MAGLVSSNKSQGPGGIHLPRNYATILEQIRGLTPGRHLTAAEVYAHVRAIQPTLGFATVHRALTRLHELGLILKLDIPGAASAVYEPAVSPHAHFRCIGCGLIRDVEFRISADAIAGLSADLGLEISVESTTFAGRCAACREASLTGTPADDLATV